MKKLICLLVIACLILPARASDAPKYIALTFDDGPNGHFTTDLLDGLAKREVYATFFLCGYRVEQFPNIAARIAAEGHEIGVHGDTHRFFSELSQEEICADLGAARQKIIAATAQEPTLLRPPGGIYDKNVLKQTCCNDLPIILWSVDVKDWNRCNSSEIASDIAKQVKNGDVILLHDTKDSGVNAALKLIDMLEMRGFEFVTVSELAYLSCTKMTAGAAYHRFSFEKKASISALPAATEPCANVGFPPPRPFKEEFKARTASRRSPSKIPRA